jgi:hypothetical protein
VNRLCANFLQVQSLFRIAIADKNIRAPICVQKRPEVDLGPMSKRLAITQRKGQPARNLVSDARAIDKQDGLKPLALPLTHCGCHSSQPRSGIGAQHAEQFVDQLRLAGKWLGDSQ